MKTILPTLNIRVDTATIRFTDVFIQLGHVRCEGWIEAPSKSDGFAACHALASHLGLKTLGACAYGSPNVGAISFPFCFDVQPGFVRPSYRREEREETRDRVLKMLRSARLYFAKSNKVATCV